jgi:proteasome accessory factor A
VAFWDYRYESPRADLRGFKLDALAFDPVDALFDRGKAFGTGAEVRSDRILHTGGRLYNDHGHPEYATPECFTLDAIARHELAGDAIMRNTATSFFAETGRTVKLYKNNTDFHGASWGTHENYLVSRRVGFSDLFAGIAPMLIARQILTGAGKVGAETGRSANFQISQRADFLVEAANAETLYRRPLFNTRDEPHAKSQDYLRLHVICGDANRIWRSTRRKVGLVQLAVALTEVGAAPIWRIPDPVRAFQSLSRDESRQFRVELANGSWTTADEILESYFSHAERFLDRDEEFTALIAECRTLLQNLRGRFEAFAREVDWAAKLRMLEWIMAEQDLKWGDPALQSYDLAYHDLDPDESLFDALVQMDWVDPNPEPMWEPEPTRALARAFAIQHHSAHLRSGAWRSLTFDLDGKSVEVMLDPDRAYQLEPDDAQNVHTFIHSMRGNS